MTRSDPPPTRWERTVTGDRWDFYVDRFAREFAEGTDLEGEARFVDVLAPRRARVLDGGCGTGRIAAALHRMGHTAVGVDRDGGLVRIAADRYPGPTFITADLLALTPDLLTGAGAPTTFDVIVLAGNVLVYVAPGTERAVLGVLAGLLAPDGRIVAGFRHRPGLRGRRLRSGCRGHRSDGGAPLRDLASGPVDGQRRLGGHRAATEGLTRPRP